MEREEEIRAIAYRIWEEEGRRDGRDFDNWLTAESIWSAQQENGAVSASDETKPEEQTGARGTHQNLILKMLGR